MNNKEKILEEIDDYANKLKRLTHYDVISKKGLTIERLDKDIFKVSSSLGNFIFTTEHAVAQFIVLNLGSIK